MEIKIILTTKQDSEKIKNKYKTKDKYVVMSFPEDFMTPMEQANYYKILKPYKDMLILTNSDYIIRSLAVYDLKNHLSNNKEVDIKLYNQEEQLLNENKSLWELDEIDYFDKPADKLIEEYSRLESKLPD